LGISELDAIQIRALVRSHVQQVVVHADCLKIMLKSDSGEQRDVLTVQWVKPSATRKRQILGASEKGLTRPIRSRARSRLLKGIAQVRLWLDQLIAGHVEGINALADRQSVSEKTVNLYESDWWSQAESNRRPLACHASALPTEL
jgi:hypothetical protein